MATVEVASPVLSEMDSNVDNNLLVTGDTGELDYEVSDAENSVRDQDEPEAESNAGDDSSRMSKNLDAEEGEIDEMEDGEVKDDAPSPILPPPRSDSPPEAFTGGRLPEQLPVAPPPPPSRGIPKPEDVGICKFFLRGSCTWGNTCKFIHPRVPGPPPPPVERLNLGPPPSPIQNRPFPPRDGPPPHPGMMNRGRGQFAGPPMRGRGGYHPGPYPLPPHPGLPMPEMERPPKKEPPEDAWERGLRQAREMMKKASQKRESEPDFEEKRLMMPLSEGPVERRSQSDSDQELEPAVPRSVARSRSRHESPDRISPGPPMGYIEPHERYPPMEPRGYQRGPPPEGGNYYRHNQPPPHHQQHFQQRPIHHHRPQPVLPPPPEKPNHNYPPPKIYRGTSAGRGPSMNLPGDSPDKYSGPDGPRREGEDGYREDYRRERNQPPGGYQRDGHQQQNYGNQRMMRGNRGGQFQQGNRQYQTDQRNMGRRYPPDGGDYNRDRGRERERGRPLPYDRPSYNEDSGWKDPWDRRKGANNRRGSKRSSSSVSTYSSRTSRSRSLSSDSSSRSSSKSRSRSLSSVSSDGGTRTKKKRDVKSSSGKTKEKVASKAAMKALGGGALAKAGSPKKETKKRKRGGEDISGGSAPKKRPVTPPTPPAFAPVVEVQSVAQQITMGPEEEERKPIKMTISGGKMKLKSGASQPDLTTSKDRRASPEFTEAPPRPSKNADISLPRRSSSKELRSPKAPTAEIPMPRNARETRSQKAPVADIPSPQSQKEPRAQNLMAADVVARRNSRESQASPPPTKKSRSSTVDSGKVSKKDTRREELLKQLRSVEDAIAKKRTK